LNNNLPSHGGDPSHPENLFTSLSLRVNDVVEEPPICIEFKQDENRSIVATLGNIVTVIGKAKSRKTYLVSLLAALFLSFRIETCPGFKASLPPDQRGVLYIDSEQGRYHAAKVLKRILRLAGLPPDQHPDNLHFLTLRPCSPEQRVKVMQYAIDNIPNLGAVIIDGSRDLLYSFNDERESIELLSLLMKLSQDKNISIINVLHQNKNDLNARGHLGSELTNKSESIREVVKEGDISIIRSNLRDRNFEDIAFGIDENDCPFLLDDFHTTQTKATYNDPADQPIQFHKNLLINVFDKDTQFSFNEFCAKIKTTAASYDVSIGDNRSREWAKYYLLEGLAENRGTDKRMIIKQVS
jgi:hypothetical protein